MSNFNNCVGFSSYTIKHRSKLIININTVDNDMNDSTLWYSIRPLQNSLLKRFRWVPSWKKKSGCASPLEKFLNKWLIQKIVISRQLKLCLILSLENLKFNLKNKFILVMYFDYQSTFGYENFTWKTNFIKVRFELFLQTQSLDSSFVGQK